MHTALKRYLSDKVELSKTQEEFVSDCFIPITTVKNEILLPEGSIANYLFFVAKGCLRVFLTNDEGTESTRFLIFENRMGTAFPSFIQRKPSVAAIQSPEASELLMLSYENRELLNKTIPGWETMERKTLERDYIESIQRIENFITADSAKRYELLVNTNPEMILRLPAKIVADYLGISPETLSRLRAKRR